MAEVSIGGETFHVEIEGDEEKPVVMLAHAMGANMKMWEPQLPALLEHYRVLRYDARGHGDSVVSEGPYSIGELGQDAVAILDSLGLDKVDFIGLSLGGMIGQWLLIHAPERIGKAVLADTAAQMAPPDIWNSRIQTVQQDGMSAVAPGVIEQWFTKDFRDSHPEEVQAVEATVTQTPQEGYAATCAAIRDLDLREALSAIEAPVLIVVGRHDTVTPPGLGALMTSSIPKAKLATLEAAHLSNIEDAAQFNDKVVEFLLAEEPVAASAPPPPPPKEKPPRKPRVKKASPPPVEAVAPELEAETIEPEALPELEVEPEVEAEAELLPEPEPAAAPVARKAPAKKAPVKKAPVAAAPAEAAPAQKVSAKKAPVKKAAAKKAAPKKAPAKKAPVKKAAVKKVAAKKVAVKKAAPKKAVAKKMPVKKAAPKKALKTAVKKTLVKKTAVKKAVKKSTLKKGVAKKAAIKKSVPKKSAAKKSVTKKSATKKSVAKKMPIKTSALRKTVKKAPPSRKTGPAKSARKPVKKVAAKKAKRR